MASTEQAGPQINPGDHPAYLQYALALAQKSPPKPTNFRVGAVLVDPASNTIVSTGFTLELEGNTHAEQCCLMKLEGLPVSGPLSLYTTMEPCSKRLSGNLPCAERIVQAKPLIDKVYVGVQEPETFVSQNTGRGLIESAGIQVVHVSGLEEEILSVAKAGHVKQ